MENQTELTPAQLAALDLLIAQKKEAPNVADSFIGGIVSILTSVMPVVKVITPTLMAAAGGVANNSPQPQNVVDALHNINKVSLEQLMEIRKNSGSK